MTDPFPISHLETARRVLECERDALTRLSESLGEPFTAVVEALLKLQGRVILAGVGKSGHVARKIAATLASTGTRALYVHPTEASHGDMGMIDQADAVVALSRSGETAELSDITAHCVRFRIPLIAITAQAHSTLGRASDHLLALPAHEEACGVTRAPTTSTTLQMALGDALAVALLEARGFSQDDFQTFHPGGSLGAGLRTLDRMMHTDMPLVERGTTLDRATHVMSGAGFGCVGVTENGRLAGIVTDGDLRRHLGSATPDTPVDDLMTLSPKVAAPDDLAADALARMTAEAPRVMQMFVVEDGVPVGLIHMHDLLRAGVA